MKVNYRLWVMVYYCLSFTVKLKIRYITRPGFQESHHSSSVADRICARFLCVQAKTVINTTVQEVDRALQLLHSQVDYMMMYIFKDLEKTSYCIVMIMIISIIKIIISGIAFLLLQNNVMLLNYFLIIQMVSYS